MMYLLDFSKPHAMKVKTLLIYIVYLLPFALFAQQQQEKRANNAFQDRAYQAAARFYEQVSDKSQNVLQNLADSYYYNSKMKQATNTYKALFAEFGTDSVPKEYLFRYAHALKGAKDFELADSIMKLYNGKSYHTVQFMDSLGGIVPYNYTPEVIGNSISGDFGLNYYQGDSVVVFASTRNKENPMYTWNCVPYLDMYKAVVTEENKLDSIQPFSEEINTKSHESNPAFTKDGKTMYFSRTSKRRMYIDSVEKATVGIYKAEMIDGKWSNIEPLPFVTPQYNSMHPALSPDEKRLYFSSDMEGSLGAYDIFYVDIKEGGIYSMPKNVGSVINTKEREQFPFVANDSILYFSSNGLPGKGGMDVFMSVAVDSSFTKPINIGQSLNSELDDFAFVVDSETDKGFFSSNRSGQDKLYSFVREDNLNSFVVEGDVTDKHSEEILEGATVRLFTEDGKVVGETVVDSTGHYKFKTKPFTTYKIEATKDLYIPYEDTFKTGEEGVFYYAIGLSLESFDDAEEIVVIREDGVMYIELENIYFDLDKWNIKPDAAKILDVLVGLMKKYPSMEVQITAHTDSQGTAEYNMILSSNRAKSSVEYIISQGIAAERLTWKGYGESKPLVPCGDNCTEVEHSINRRCEFIVVK